jgi:hypothetical protein
LAIRRRTAYLGLAALVAAVAVFSGCPFEFSSEPRPNAAPTTFFLADPTDTTFSNQMSFSWNGTDEDSDVVAYQYQLVFISRNDPLSPPSESIDPFNTTGAEQWSARTTDDFRSFVDLDDGFYEMRVRAIDQQGTVDPDPARHKFFVFFDDISPEPDILIPETESSRITTTSIFFVFTARDFSRSGEVDRKDLEYSYQLRAESQTLCGSHLTDAFTEWEKFPTSGDPVTVGLEAPTIYNDLFPNGCSWMFTLRVRDPAGNIGLVTHRVEKIPPP